MPNLPEPKIDYFHWGLIPSWAKEPANGNRLINARSESLAEKPSFPTTLKRSRCLIPADGFYDWKLNPVFKTKTPMYLRMKGGRHLASAGRWETWRNADGSTVSSCTIITTRSKRVDEGDPRSHAGDRARGSVSGVAGFEGEETGGSAAAAAAVFGGGEEAFAVSKTVNNPKNKTAECIEGITEGEDRSVTSQ